MFLSLLKDRLSFTLVVVVAGLVTAFVTGNGLLAAIIGIGAGLSVNAIWAARSRRDSVDLSDQSNRLPGHPFVFQFTWTVNEKPDLARLAVHLSHRGLTSDPDFKSETAIVLEGGSQLRSRLLGGYFVDPKYLPVRAELRVTNGEKNAGFMLELQVRDTAGVAIRDKALEARYAQAANKISEIVERSLNPFKATM